MVLNKPMFKKLMSFAVVLFAFFLGACSFLTTSTTTTLFSTTTNNTSEVSLTQSTETVIDNSYENLFDNQIYKKFVIHFSNANFFKLISDMENYHDEFGSYRDNTIQEVDIDYTDSLGNTISMNEVGFRTKGNIFSRVLPVIKDSQGNITGYQQVSFQLEFNETFEYLENSTQYKELKERRGFDLEQLNFKYIKSSDTSGITEMMAYKLYNQVGVVTSKASFAIIYFDIEGTLVPYGLFLVQEPIDDVFVKRYFGRDQDGTVGDLYKCVWQTEPAKLTPDYNSWSLGVSDYEEGYRKSYQLKTNKATSNFSQFTSFVSKLNNNGVINYQNVLEQNLDVDSLLRAFAIGFLIGSPDDYRSDANNYYLYFYEDKAIYIPFDMDQCLGYGWDPFGNHGLDLDVLTYQPAQSNIGSASDLPLSYNILAIDEYRNTYLNYLIEYTNPVDGIFDYQDFFKEFTNVKSLYETEIRANNHLGIDTFSTLQRDMNPQDYYTQKASYVRTHAQAYLK
jgi:spore coat protein CotH